MDGPGHNLAHFLQLLPVGYLLFSVAPRIYDLLSIAMKSEVKLVDT